MFKDCFAYYDENTSTIRLGNSKIEKVIRIDGNRIRTENVRDIINSFEWSGNSLWQRCPVFSDGEKPKITFETEFIENPYIMKPHLKASLCFEGKEGSAWYEYLVFPEIGFIYNQNFVSK